MFYNNLRDYVSDHDDRTRAARNLIRLRHQLDDSVPAKDSEDNLLLATWNIRDFDKQNRRGWGKRLPETWFYIAEVISRFDFVAVQEINRLSEWQKVMRILGRDWAYIATDESDPAIGGNGERLTYVYDRRKVTFQSIAGEIVLPSRMLISKAEMKIRGKTVVAGKQFRRTPFLAMFQSGWLKFDICTVHIYYGDDAGVQLDERVEEIETIAGYLGKRADRALGDERALILLGDFNIVSPQHKTMKALTNNGFIVPKALQEKPTTGSSRHYDQIAFKTAPDVVEYVDSQSADPLKRNAGVIPIFESVLTDEQFSMYKEIVKAKSTAGKKAKTTTKLREVYQDWRTYQFSDHYPMWVRLKTDASAAYLERQAKA
jgi:endonuclease/exonuclease/phosphatase family metal-dependent hydrolase